MAEEKELKTTGEVDSIKESTESLMSRRKLLATMGMAGIAMTASGLMNGTTGKAYGMDLLGWIVTTISELRAMTTPDVTKIYYVRDREQEGPFYFDSSDTISMDNTGTILVSSSGARFKRIYDGAVNVRWFGAKGDGINDDASAIQKAVDVGATGDRGVSVFIPDGVYIIKSTIHIYKPNTSITGTSRTLTEIRVGVGSALDNMIYVHPADQATLSPTVNLTFSRLSLYGSQIAKNAISGYVSQSYFAELFIGRTVENAIYLHRCWTNWFIHLNIAYNGGNGINLVPEANNIVIRDCEIQNNGQDGIVFSNGAVFEVSNCGIESNGRYGISIETTDANSVYYNPPYLKQYTQSVTINNCYFENNSINLAAGVEGFDIHTISGAVELPIRNLLIENCYFNSLANQYAFLQNSNVKIVNWRNNFLIGIYKKAIKINYVADNFLGGEVATSYEGVAMSDIAITNAYSSEMFSLTDFTESGSKRYSGLNIGEHHNHLSALGDITFDRASLKFGIASKLDTGRIFDVVPYFHRISRAMLPAAQKYDGKVILDSDNGTPYLYLGESWYELAHYTKKSTQIINGVTFSITKWGNIIQLFLTGTATSMIMQGIGFLDVDITAARTMNLTLLSRDGYTIQTRNYSSLYAYIPSGQVLNDVEFTYISE